MKHLLHVIFCLLLILIFNDFAIITQGNNNIKHFDHLIIFWPDKIQNTSPVISCLLLRIILKYWMNCQGKTISKFRVIKIRLVMHILFYLTRIITITSSNLWDPLNFDHIFVFWPSWNWNTSFLVINWLILKQILISKIQIF